jgi:hypothetical protein
MTNGQELPYESQQYHRRVLEALPVAIYTTDATGKITFYNPAAADFAGRRPALGVDEWCVTWRLYQLDGTPLPHNQCPMAVALKDRRPVRGQEAVAERPDGTRVPFRAYPTPLYDSAGALVGAVNLLMDISNQKRSQAEGQRVKALPEERVGSHLQQLISIANKPNKGQQTRRWLVRNRSDNAESVRAPRRSVARWMWRLGPNRDYASAEITGKRVSRVDTEATMRAQSDPLTILPDLLRRIIASDADPNWLVRSLVEGIASAVVAKIPPEQHGEFAVETVRLLRDRMRSHGLI